MPASAQICCIEAPWKLDLLVAALGARQLRLVRIGQADFGGEIEIVHVSRQKVRTFILKLCE
jgi:hypothetical protein